MLACLGDSSRFRLVAELAGRPRCVTDLARVVGLSQSCTTRHLQALEREGLIVGKRDGKRVVFRLCLEEPEVAALISWALQADPDRGAGAMPDPLIVTGANLHREVESGALPRFDAWRPRTGKAGGSEAHQADLDVVQAATKNADPAREIEPEEPAPRERQGDLEDFLL
jgi:DNA-binding transcriptional ArsR family regulator